ncbi:MAG: hypothetical protein HYX43_09640 [Burkholderiales bacterium]|nr:hypothetical protein [Burkholderiales bacterium]
MSNATPSAFQSAQSLREYRHQPPSLYVVASFYDWLMEVSADLAEVTMRLPGAVEAAREDEIARLLTLEGRLLDQGAHTQQAYSGLEVWPSPDRTDEWRARYSFTLAEAREGHSRVLAGWNGFVLRQTLDGLRIVLKQVNLLDGERPQGNNSFFL